MNTGLAGPLVSAGALAERLGAAGLVLLDASFYLPAEGQDGRGLYEAAHLPGARFFDIDAVADHTTDLPHMLPAPTDFAAAVEALGIGDDTAVVVYDQKGVFSAPRVWWMFQVFGHDNVAVLDGGLPEWRRLGLPLSAEPPAPPAPARFTPRFRPELVRDFAAVADHLAGQTALVLDARQEARFAGQVPEPRPGLRAGHMPGAKNLPYGALLTQGRYRAPEELRAVFAAAGVDGRRPVVTSCGSGVSAAVLTLGLVLAGLPQGALYDGSWAEWGGRAQAPVETGT